jgi:hypothetical protein
MKTELGEIIILINERSVNFNAMELPEMDKSFSVNARYRLDYQIPKIFLNKNIEIKCMLKNEHNNILERNIESGENLALISFYSSNIKLSIGTRGNREGVKYKYLENGIQISGYQFIESPFYVAWLYMEDRDSQEVYTWFAADPSFDKLI